MTDRLWIAYGLLALLVVAIVGAGLWVRAQTDLHKTRRRRQREEKSRAKR